MAEIPAKNPLVEREEKVLDFWNKENIFQKSLEKEAPKGDFVFYDGPPFATGSPHFGHVLPTSIKDAIPRYKTMQGYRVRRRWGWDCHGLPVENLIEKELGLKSKKDILDYGIGAFNAKAKESVLRYADEWRKIIPRLGRWVDMENDYRTMDASYTESVWWAFKNLYEKNLVSEGFKAMQLCPRCETTLSNFEVNQGYKDITDISIYVKFELTDEPGTYLLAWTTTPWTLPGNVALAVGTDVSYVKVEEVGGSTPGLSSKYIFAEERLAVISAISKKEFTVISKTKGAELLGKSYIPVFDYYSKNTNEKNRTVEKNVENAKNGWKVYGADFVTTTDGTGIVHIAPAFGSDDMELGKKHSLPFIQHVGTDGKFKKEVIDFAGQLVKPKSSEEEKDAHQKGDIEIIKYLALPRPSATVTGAGKSPALFAKEKIIHSYPHCWRCDTPLLNYASSSWFVKVPDIKNKLVAENKKVNWIPEEVGEGRFGNWLSGARDWAISRSRFWGAPLPVWRTEPDASGGTSTNSETVVIGSLADLKKYSHANNTYFAMRHGEAENNTKSIISSTATTPHHLTEKGREQAAKAAEWLKDKKIDLMIVSPFVRTRETAAIVAERIGFPSEKIIFDDRLHELNAGDYDGMGFREFISKFPFDKRFEIRPPNGENYTDIKKRMGDFIYDIDTTYSGEKGGKNILIVSHDSPLFLLVSAVQGLSKKETVALRGKTDHFVLNAVPMELDFVPIPHNEFYELDFHRPFIDDVVLYGKNGVPLARVPEVFDCWFESGSMPFAEAHYPQSQKHTDAGFAPRGGLFKKSKGYPADFIAEGLDQTRGWFYSMLVLGVGLFGKTPYKNVIVNGLVLAEDGQKMSKSKKNFPDLMPVVEKYGADALRFYLLSSPLVRAQEFCFAERGVDEVAKKHIGRLNNVVTFYEMFADTTTVTPISGYENKKDNVLDQWILSRLAEVNRDVTKALDVYELDRATRPFAEFIDDLSTWYLRRSRDRFKSENLTDKTAALATTKKVLIEVAKLVAPFMPFLAEDIYLRVTGSAVSETRVSKSVHLEVWPQAGKIDEVLLKKMSETRRVTSLALEARMKAKINVRQPLARLSLKTVLLESIFTELVKDEVNIKEIIQDALISEEIILDTELSTDLKEEGNVREFMRVIQDLRKRENFVVSDSVTLCVSTDTVGKNFLEKNRVEISKTTGLKNIVFTDELQQAKDFLGYTEAVVATMHFTVSLKK